MMKNMTAALTACMMLGGMMTCIPVSAEEIEGTYGALTYVSNGASIAITACDTSVTEVEIPQYIDNMTVEAIGDSAFYNCEALTSVTIPESVRTIEAEAFEDCESLTTINLPASLMELSESVFEGCDALESITVSAGSEMFQSIDGVLFDNSGTVLLYYPSGKADSVYTIPEGTTGFPHFAFDNCPNLTELVFPASLNAYDSSSLRYCEALTTITVAEGNTYCKSVDGVLFSEDGHRLYRYPAGRTDEAYSIPESVSEIDVNAFYGNKYIQSVTCPEGMYDIRSSAFYDCWNLQSIDLPQNMSSIGSDAFAFCYDLTSIDLPDDLTEIGGWAFAYCSSLTELSLPSGLTRIGAGTFQGCSGLTTLTIPEAVTTIDMYAFYDCSGMTSITIPASTTEIGGGAFAGCTALTDVYFSGTESEWNFVNVAMDNDGLNNAVVHYNSEAPVTPPASTSGDLNGDSICNASDAAVLLTAAAAAGAGGASGLTAELEAAADVNASGGFDAADAALILQYAAYTGAGGTDSIDDFVASMN